MGLVHLRVNEWLRVISKKSNHEFQQRQVYRHLLGLNNNFAGYVGFWLYPARLPVRFWL
jgi:hypothetical protein